MAYLDENGLEHFWGKIKDHVSSAIAPKANDADVLHKTGTETVSGEKVFSGSQTTPSGNASALLVVKDPNLVKGETPEIDHYLSLGFIDSTGNSYAQDTASRLAVVEYKSPSEADPSGYMQMVDRGFNGGGTALIRVGHDKDNIQYASAPATSDDRTNSTDIVTRGYMEASEWNWQKTKKDALVQFKPVPESDLEPVVDFMFTETPPAEGEKSPSNPSAISGVSGINIGICGKNLLRTSSTSSGIFTIDSDGTLTANGVLSSTTHFAFIFPLSRPLPPGKYTLSFNNNKAASDVRCSLRKSDSNWGSTDDTGRDGYLTTANNVRAVEIKEGSDNALFRLTFPAATYDNLVIKIQLESGTVATEYEPPVRNGYTIALGDTYYGGSLDVATGVMTVTYVGIAYDGTNLNWNTSALSNGTRFFIGNDSCFPGRKLGISAFGVCSHFIKLSASSDQTLGGFGYYGTSAGGYFNYPVENATVSDWNTYLATQYANNTPVTVVYELATPATVQLTPTQIRSLPALDKYESRINTVYTDQEAVQVGYQRFANYVDLTTEQSIFGRKRFADYVFINNKTDTTKVSQLRIEDLTFRRGDTAPSSNKSLGQVVFCGSDQNFYGSLTNDIWSDGSIVSSLSAFKNISSNNSAILRVVNPATGSPYATAPSTPDTGSNTDILTRNWIPKDTRIVHTTGNEIIDGRKYFYGSATVFGSPDNAYERLYIGSITDGIRVAAENFGLDSRGAGLQLSGRSSSSYPGQFIVFAVNSTATKELIGRPDGTLTWNGQAIQTSSDERVKTPLSEVPDAVLDAWEEVNWGQFQYLDAVEAKGESARLHLGLIAQHVMSVFGKHGLDACAYGILCHEERPAVDEEETVVDVEAYVDDEGVEHPAVTHVETRHEDAVDLWMVRYAEAQAMEACCARRENARLKKRIADLEERLAALELKIS